MIAAAVASVVPDILEVVRSAEAEPDPTEVARITVQTDVDASTVDDLYQMYVAAFQILTNRAAVQHVLPRETFEADMHAPSINKIIAWDGAGQALGLATLTTDLASDHLISEAFYAERFPQAHAHQQLWYQGYLLVRPDAQRGGVLARLVRTIVSHVSAAGGVVAFDVCRFNDDTYKYAQVLGLMARRLRPSTIETVDVQSFYAVTFPPGEAVAAG